MGMRWSTTSKHLTVIVVLVIPILSVMYLKIKSRLTTSRSLISSSATSYVVSALCGSFANSSMTVRPARKSRSLEWSVLKS
jgi:hypothetical protein